MSQPVDNLSDFFKKVFEILFWILIFSPMIIFPIILLVENYMPMRISDMMANPEDMFALLDSDIFRVAVFPGFTFAAAFAAFIGLWERKLLAKMQMRVGPFYAGRFEGILQPIADLLKLIGKEIITPRSVDKPFFWAVPLITTAIAASLLAIIPISETSVIARSDVGVLIIFAILSFFPVAALMAGWASNSKYPLIGALRALHQMVAYEIPMILSILGIVILSSSMNLIEIVNVQESAWFLFLQPIGAVIFFITAL
ncbi:MAG: NADH-quinone oxidoreductase subunit H, partial [Nitrososphaerales archaeon]